VRTFVLLAAGLGLLGVGGEMLVRGASQLASRFGVSPLVVGLTVVAFGTSAPELAVSLQAVQADAADIAVGNVLGSNIFNILLILGLSAVIAPLTITRRIVRIEVPLVIAISALAWLLARDGRVAALDGVMLLIAVVAYTGWMLWSVWADAASEESSNADATPSGPAVSTVTALAGLGLLVLGSRWFVEGAVGLAQSLGVSDVVIGLTVVAAGTSLPEVAASLVAAARGHRDMAVGNVLGSNIFNLTVILGTTAVAAGGLTVAPGVVSFDLIVMVAVAVACLPIFVTGHRIARWEGGLFLAYYIAYTTYIVLDATGHDQLPHFRDAMIFFALPLTAMTLLILATRSVVRHGFAGR
jgi:cation:H+ antiporter